MKDIPAEIVNQIFCFLHQRDKLECMTVCRKWETLIESCCLFQTIRIGNIHQMNKLIAKVQQEPKQGKKVECLVLDVDLEPDFKMDMLPFLFPNVNKYSFFNLFEKNDYYYMPFTNKLSPHHPWDRHIEHITEYSADLHAQYILQSGLCPHLRSIVISGTDYDQGSKFISLLINAPALKTLNMTDFSLSMSDFETLHKATPLLESLTFHACRISCHVSPINVEPATMLSKLSLTHATISFGENCRIILLRYISMKYTHLSELTYDVGSINYNRVEYKDEVYKDVFHGWMKSLGRQLKKASFILDYDDVNPFEALDASDCQIQKLEFGQIITPPTLRLLIQSDQIRYIQSLTINYSLSSRALEWLNKFIALKELSLSHQKGPVSLDQLLKIIGRRLERLELHMHNLALDDETSDLYQYPLKFLMIDNTWIPRELDNFISQRLPNLKTLKFKKCMFPKTSFLLPSIQLSLLEIVDRFPPSNGSISVTTLCNDEKRCYTAKPTYSWDRLCDYDATVFPAIISKPFTEMSGSPLFSLVLYSLRTMLLINSMQ